MMARRSHQRKAVVATALCNPQRQLTRRSRRMQRRLVRPGPVIRIGIEPALPFGLQIAHSLPQIGKIRRGMDSQQLFVGGSARRQPAKPSHQVRAINRRQHRLQSLRSLGMFTDEPMT
jgi:hypothetical protein